MNVQLKETIRRFLPRTVRPYRILSGFLRGKTLYTSLYDYPAAVQGRTESELMAWLTDNVKPGEIWLDIGAHYGYISLALSFLVGNAGKVYAFEPMLTTAGFLNLTRQANDLSQLVILPFALGAVEGPNQIRLPVTRGMADSTLEQSDRFETILQVNFDSLWNRLSTDEHVTGIKIDVQGMELDVLTGMQSFLRAQKPKIILEFHSGVDRSEVMAFLSSCGYALPGFALELGSGSDVSEYLDNHSYLFIPED